VQCRRLCQWDHLQRYTPLGSRVLLPKGAVCQARR
jgi:hypothetical protein